jgi:hypothetical protein
VELLVDKYVHDKHRIPVMVHKTLYGQVLYVAHAFLPLSTLLKIKEDSHEILAIVQWCKDANGDAMCEVVWYASM